MSPNDRQNEIDRRMDEAFVAGPGSEEEKALLTFLAEHPEYQTLWMEYQNLRRGMTLLEDKAAPSEMTRARIHHASCKRPQTAPRPSRGWRWFLSQPVVAAATVLLVVGFGIYSQYLFRETKKAQPPLPAAEKREIPAEPQPLQMLEKTDAQSRKAPAPSAPEKKLKSPIPFHEAAPPPPAGAGATGLSHSTVPEEAPKEAPAAVDRARDQEEGAIAPAAAPVVAPQLKAQQAPAPSRYDRLLAQAKDKIAEQDCPAATKLLVEAQKIRDTDEVQKLIAQCQKSR